MNIFRRQCLFRTKQRITGKFRINVVNMSDQSHREHGEATLKDLNETKLVVPTVSLQEIIRKSRAFQKTFPSDTARLQNLVKIGVAEDRLRDFCNSVYPIVHHSCLDLFRDFLDYKIQHGTSIERELYTGMNIVSFVDRLLKKRPISFYGNTDVYHIKAASQKFGTGGFENIGTVSETPPLMLNDFLSYDEIRLAALVSLSSWSCFINDGRRQNCGELDHGNKHQKMGVIVGQVGPRLEREDVMEYLDCIVTKKHNSSNNGFGDLANPVHLNAVWSKFWGGRLASYAEAESKLGRKANDEPTPFEYMAIGLDKIFNITVYKRRIGITAHTLLCEATSRAKAQGKKAYIHVVGLGLGVWRGYHDQDELFVEAWGDAMRDFSDLSHIAYVDFSYIKSQSVHGVRHDEKFPNSDVTVRFTKRNLHDKVPDDCILVCNYAWDGNSLPGNEFWEGMLFSTGDCAAACSSCVAEIHNHYINPVVCGSSMRVATQDGLILNLTDYLAKLGGKLPDFSQMNEYGVESRNLDEKKADGVFSSLFMCHK